MHTSSPTLVTGGCGFVGRHLVKRLLEGGRSVWIVDNLSTGKDPHDWLSDSWTEAAGDGGGVTFRKDGQELVFVHDDAVNFFASQLQIVGTQQPFELPVFFDVFHLASVVGGRMTIERDPMAVAIDFAIDAIFFRWAVANRDAIGRVLYASSSAAYPVHMQTERMRMALREDLIDFDGELGMPDMTYGWGKLTGEYLSRIAVSHYGMHVACVRPFSGYGGDQDQVYPVPAIAARAARHEDPLVVWGSGEQGRDFVHIDDCIEAMLRTIEAVSDGRGINIGSGTLTTFKELAGLLARLAGYKPVIKPLSDKPEGVQARYSDIALMKEILNWQPTVSLEEGMRRVLAEQQELVAKKIRA